MIKDAGVGLCEPGCSEFEIRLQNVERKPYSVILNAVKDLAQSSARLGDQPSHYDRAADMVVRERQFKGWTRRRKLALIHTQNPEMADYARRTARNPSLRPRGSFAFDSGWPRRPPSFRMTEGVKGR